MDVSNFNEKLNKLDGKTYVIEELVTPKDDIYEAELAHDNITLSTLNVYTGAKLTGDKIETYITSTPSLTPWKTIIKIYSEITPLYISYETGGDTIEADDINKLQDAVVDTQNNLNNLSNNLATYENETESNLNNRYTKEQVFTKDEVLQKINDLIGTAPKVLDTFAEIANALGNDPSFATTIVTLLSQKADSINIYSKDEINNKLTDLGSGDMTKAVYDADNDGIVDKAKKIVGPITWNDLEGV